MSDSLERDLLSAARRAYEPAPDAEARVKTRVLAALAVTSASGAVQPHAPMPSTAGTASAATSGTSAAMVVGGFVVLAVAIAIALVRGSTAEAPALAPPSTDVPAAPVSLPLQLEDDRARAADPFAPTPTPAAERAVVEADGRARPERRPRTPVAREADTASTEPARTEPASAEPARTEPARTEPASTEPASTEPARAEATSAEPASAEEDPLAAELALLERAGAAVRAGDGSGALALLEAHRARFAHGVLAAERETLAVEALCAQGRVAEARTRAGQLLASSPSSPHARRLRASCGAP